MSPWFERISRYYLREMFDHVGEPQTIVKKGIIVFSVVCSQYGIVIEAMVFGANGCEGTGSVSPKASFWVILDECCV